MTDLNALYRVIYISNSRIPGSRQQQEVEIRRILVQSRRNNMAAELTGALMFTSTWFAQALEGPLGRIRELFQRLHHDPRHAGIATIEMSEIAGRLFPSWSMAYVPFLDDVAHPMAHMTFEELFLQRSDVSAQAVLGQLQAALRAPQVAHV